LASSSWASTVFSRLALAAEGLAALAGLSAALFRGFGDFTGAAAFEPAAEDLVVLAAFGAVATFPGLPLPCVVAVFLGVEVLEAADFGLAARLGAAAFLAGAFRGLVLFLWAGHHPAANRADSR